MTSPDQSARVSEEFDHGANHYDLLVRLNPGYHAHLARAAAELRRRVPDADQLIDLGCGTGLSTRALVRAAPATARVVGIDASLGMLNRARRKTWPDHVQFRYGVAGALAESGVRADGILSCYVLRNVPEAQRDDAMRDTCEVLEPGGWFVLQDYTVRGNSPATNVWNVICWSVIIPLGVLSGRNFALYRYLWRSVLENDSTQRVMKRMSDAGYVDVAVRTVPGWQRGILHIYVGRKP